MQKDKKKIWFPAKKYDIKWFRIVVTLVILFGLGWVACSTNYSNPAKKEKNRYRPDNRT